MSQTINNKRNNDSMEKFNTQKDSFPKISVDSRYDIEFLKNQFRQSVNKICDEMEKNNKLYPQNFDDITISKKRKRVTKDKLKKKWRNELNQAMENWIEQVFTMAGPNILIGGENYEDVFNTEEAHEPLDDHLAKTLSDLDKKISVLQVEISEQRRKYSEAIKKMTVQEIKIKNKEIKKTKINDVSKSVIEIEDDDPEVDWENIQKKYQHILQLIGELTKNEKNEKNNIYSSLIAKLKNIDELITNYKEQEKTKKPKIN
ncbi:hypothetical protein BCR32DRAFT_265262 [Anaeromyces robustus]|uniref:Uncharacterized protein n=1 Tax=Anaeromyces robustus TaxID=1754192 RepID=A0A1Y1XJZ5_9FUNG|nr:hypothetical protein BCR32DRAFT_265262 [Anaeromyces robustus]|eukprot:ORX86068.1 hypothetical protein BCR32DRAFT_265262 [Anaeromyces robustus]